MMLSYENENKAIHIQAVLQHVLEVANSAQILTQGLFGLSTVWVIWIYGRLKEENDTSAKHPSEVVYVGSVEKSVLDSTKYDICESNHTTFELAPQKMHVLIKDIQNTKYRRNKSRSNIIKPLRDAEDVATSNKNVKSKIHISSISTNYTRSQNFTKKNVQEKQNTSKVKEIKLQKRKRNSNSDAASRKISRSRFKPERTKSSKVPTSKLEDAKDAQETFDVSSDFFNHELSEDSDSDHSNDDYEPDENTKAEEDHSTMFFQCAECCEKFKTSTSLQIHIQKEKHRSLKKRCRCAMCPFSTRKVIDLLYHVRTHTGEKPYKCDLCDAAYIRVSLLKSHKETHSAVKKYTCEECNKTFSNKERLASHRKLKHSQHRPHLCDECGKSFVHRSKMLSHKRVHTDSRFCQCTICKKLLSSKRSLMRHVKLYHGEEALENVVSIVEKENGNMQLQSEMLEEGNVNLLLECNKTNLFQCAQCLEAFNTDNDLKAHIKRENHTAVEKRFQCASCGFSTKDGSGLTFHVRIHTGEKPYVCELCGLGFARVSRLNLHKETHNPVKQYICDICSRSFHNREGLSSHRKSSHPENRPYSCTQCGKAFSNRCRLEQHVRCHLGQKLFQCKICNKSLSSKTNLIGHMRSFHREELQEVGNGNFPPQTLQCQKCGMLLGTSSALRYHMIRHSGLRDFICKNCGKGFITKQELDKHFKAHGEDRPYQCSQCGKAFKQSGSLKIHEKIHLEFKAFQCDVCSKTFVSIERLKVHKIMHSGIKKHKCLYCERDFAYKSGLNKHLLTHTGVKKFQCKLCSRSFAISWNLKVHQKTVHNKEKMHACKCGESFMRRNALMEHEKTCLLSINI